MNATIRNQLDVRNPFKFQHILNLSGSDAIAALLANANNGDSNYIDDLSNIREWSGHVYMCVCMCASNDMRYIYMYIYMFLYMYI
jgi:hypothetical protein